MSHIRWDHPAGPRCYHAVRVRDTGEICVLCYYHVLAWSKVRISKHGDVAVCQECGNALAARTRFTPATVRALMECLLRRLAFDNVTSRARQMIEEYEIGEDTVVH